MDASDEFTRKYQMYLNAVTEFEREAATRARYLQQLLAEQDATLDQVNTTLNDLTTKNNRRR